MKYILTIFLCFSCETLFAQANASSDLYKILKVKDSLLFDVAFNNCDVSPLEDLISDNFEFYHDEAGVMSSKAAFIASIRDGICKLTYKARRELVANSLKVYPLMKDGVLYGAIQTGRHRFYALEKKKPEYLTSV